MTIEGDVKLINKTWGAEEALYSFLKAEIRTLYKVICCENAVIPRVMVKPSFLARGLLGGRLRGGEYEPAENNYEATVSVFPFVCADRALLRIVLAHELIHHWEHMLCERSQSPEYDDADNMISAVFRDPQKKRSWRAGHSRQFVAKGALVARILGVPLRELLFSG